MDDVGVKVVLVEDDRLTAEMYVLEIQASFPSCEVVTLTTELAFIEWIDEFSGRSPNVFVIDVMLRWDQPRRYPVERQGVATGSYFRAGIRCAQRVAESSALRSVPIILTSALDKGDVQRSLDVVLSESKIRIQPKSGSLDPLIRQLRSIFSD